MIGSKTQFQPVYVGDIAKAVLACLKDKVTVGSCYELGGPTIYTFRELMEIMLNEIGRKRVLIPIPFWAASIKALFLEHLRIPFFVPKPMLTRDQVQLLKADNVVRENNLGIQNLGIVPTPLQAVLPGYLNRYRPAKYKGRTAQIG